WSKGGVAVGAGVGVEVGSGVADGKGVLVGGSVGVGAAGISVLQAMDMTTQAASNIYTRFIGDSSESQLSSYQYSLESTNQQ
ncbi:MAG: hypothetical protein N2C13_01850, partial [Chloroflexota bacterium]